MHDTSDRFVVLTGGQGSGKTTLIEALGRAGHACSVEAGRAGYLPRMTNANRISPKPCAP